MRKHLHVTQIKTKHASPLHVTPHNWLGFPNKLLVPIYTFGWREAHQEHNSVTSQGLNPDC